MSRDTRQAATVVGLYLFIAIAYAATLRLGDWWFRGSWFAASTVSATPPWRFIGRDLSAGPFAGTALIVLTLIVVACRRLAGPHAWAVLASVPVSFATSLALAANVLLHSSGIGHPHVAQSAWTTFDEYMASQAIAQRAGLAAGGVVSLLCLGQYIRALRSASREAA